MIKENRTYDQVLGNLGKGDGDPALTLFDEDSAPEPPATSRGASRCSTTSIPTPTSPPTASAGRSRRGSSDYIDKTWPISYSPGARSKHRARDFEQVTAAQEFFTEPLAFDRTIFRGARGADARLPVGQRPPQRASRTATTASTPTCPPTAAEAATPRRSPTSTTRRFGDHVDERYPGFNLDCPDHTVREPEWEREFNGYVGAYQADPSHDPLPQL